MVVGFVAVVHLGCIEFAHACDGVCAVHALDGAQFVLVGIAPGYGFVPVEVRGHRVSFFVFFDLEILVSAVCRVGKAFADNGVADPEYELLVLAVRNLGFVHPEAVDGDTAGVCAQVPERVVFLHSDFHRTAVDQHHAVGCRFGPCRSAYTGDFAAS